VTAGGALADWCAVWVAGVQQTWCPPQVYALLHKPCGLLSAMSDPHGRPHIGQILPWVRLKRVG
jgi:16S rRNA U516 pseudouridylate synthase RsuA-like enzyme